VLDRDDNPAQQFNAALALAKENGIEAAYTNEFFRVW